MATPTWYLISILAWTVLALITFPFLFKTIAPFGRHTHKSVETRGIASLLIPNRLGWVIMESPAVWWMALLVMIGPADKSIAVYVIVGLWMLHYIHRVAIFPFRTRTQGKKMPLQIVISAFVFQLVNGFLNGYYFGWMGDGYAKEWLSDPRMIAGIVLFISGMIMNQWADAVLINLRKPGETGYKIPRGGLFEWVSCPNFLGEIIEWGGFALMCWNWAGLSFFIWTLANLLPRAWAHHRWYKEHFADYPAERKAVLPGVF